MFVRSVREREGARGASPVQADRQQRMEKRHTLALFFSPLPPPRQGERCTLRNVPLVPIVPMVPIEKRFI